MHLLPADLAEQDGGPHAQGPAVGHAVDQGRQGVAGVEDVVEQEHVAARDVGGERLVDDQGAGGGRRPLVAAGLKQRDPQGELDLADQVGQQDQAAGQDGDDRQRPALVVRLDLPAELLHPRLDLVLGEQDLHGVRTSRWGMAGGRCLAGAESRPSRKT